MISATDNRHAAIRHREEILFLAIVLTLSAMVGLGFWYAATSVSRRDEVHGFAPEKPRALADFTLTDSTGRTVTRAELEGTVLAVNFIITSCSLTCQAVSTSMAEVQRLTTGEPDVRLVSFTADPRTDTAPVLAKWGARYGADTNRWLLLTGGKKEVQALIAASFIADTTNNPFNFSPGDFVGTGRIAVVDKHGNVRKFFNGQPSSAPAVVAAEIERLRKEN